MHGETVKLTRCSSQYCSGLYMFCPYHTRYAAPDTLLMWILWRNFNGTTTVSNVTVDVFFLAFWYVKPMF